MVLYFRKTYLGLDIEHLVLSRESKEHSKLYLHKLFLHSYIEG